MQRRRLPRHAHEKVEEIVFRQNKRVGFIEAAVEIEDEWTFLRFPLRRREWCRSLPRASGIRLEMMEGVDRFLISRLREGIQKKTIRRRAHAQSKRQRGKISVEGRSQSSIGCVEFIHRHLQTRASFR